MLHTTRFAPCYATRRADLATEKADVLSTTIRRAPALALAELLEESTM